MATEAEPQAGPMRASVSGVRAGRIDVPAAEALLGRLLASSTALRFAGLSTLDGHPVAAAGAITPAAAGRVAAMASSLLALSETFTRETASGRCAYTTVTAAEGLIVVVRVPTRDPRYALCAGSDSSGNLGMVLRRTLDASQSLAQHIDAGDS